MTAIQKCQNSTCKSRFSCFRYLADAEDYKQEYLSTKLSDTKCDEYWKVRNRKELKAFNSLNRVVNIN